MIRGTNRVSISFVSSCIESSSTSAACDQLLSVHREESQGAAPWALAWAYTALWICPSNWCSLWQQPVRQCKAYSIQWNSETESETARLRSREWVWEILRSWAVHLSGSEPARRFHLQIWPALRLQTPVRLHSFSLTLPHSPSCVPGKSGVNSRYLRGVWFAV